MAKMNARYLLTMLPKSAWEQFNNLYIDFNSKKKPHSEDLYQIIGNSQRFFAIISDGMQRNDVFNFIKLGRFIERADMLSRIIEDQILRKEAKIPKYYENLQWMSVLKSVNGFESFKKINKGELKQSNVLDFMVKLKEFPRSIIFCINRLIAVTKYLPNSENLKLKLTKIKKQAVKLNEKSTDKQILVILDLLQLGLIDLHLEIEKKFFNSSPI